MDKFKDIELWLGDCLDLMKNIPDSSVDLIFADLPYGTTAKIAKALKRNYLGFDVSQEYIDIANKRINE